MPEPNLIEEQIQLERDQIKQGLKRLRDSTLNLENKNYASASIYGIATIDSLLPLVVERINETHTRLKERKNGVAFKEIQQYLTGLEPLAAAAIACKITLDKVFGYKDSSNQLTNICNAIGNAVEDECQLRHYEDTAPGLLNVLKKNYWHRACGTQQKIQSIQTLMNRYEVKRWNPWGTSNRVKLGSWLLNCILEASGWFQKEQIRVGKKTTLYVAPTPEFLDIKDQVMANAELFSPLTWPMLVPPNDWTNHTPGGYILNEVMHGHDLVRRGNNALIQGETPIAFLNQIQKVAYKLNPFIVEVAEVLMERGIDVGKFRPIMEHALPPKPVDIADNKESRQAYRRTAAEAMNRNAQEFKRSCRTRMTMEAVARFKDVDKFFIPWSFDYRGRTYPIPAFLTPQDTDFGKSLLKFAREAFMTPEAEQWLAIQVATTYGLDKSTMSERIAWTRDNYTLISRIAEDPIGCLPDWEGAEEPWQFLAACEEYYHCVILCDRNYTSLMVASDATASGIQILAGLARDKSSAILCNVVPSDRPVDAYQVIADESKAAIPASIKPHWDRRCTKRTVMTIPYNAKPFSNRSYIREALLEKGVVIDKDDLTLTVRAVRDAMHRVVPGCLNVMKWIEDEVSKTIKHGATELEWCTPSGFVVHQKLMKKKVERLNLQLLGRCTLNVATDETNKVDISRHKAATAPNLIHSLDASLLHLSAVKFNAPLALIHDSVLARATDMSQLSSVVRETYMYLFAEHDYLTSFAKQIGAKEEPPIIGDLEPSSVIESTYFFC